MNKYLLKKRKEKKRRKKEEEENKRIKDIKHTQYILFELIIPIAHTLVASLSAIYQTP